MWFSTVYIVFALLTLQTTGDHIWNNDNFEDGWQLILEIPAENKDLDPNFSALRLVRFFHDQGFREPVWVSETEKLEAKKRGHDFIDVTEHPDFGSKDYGAFQSHQIYHPPNSTFVPRILPLLSSKEQRINLETLTSFYTRYYKSESGHNSSRWLYQRAVNYTAEYASQELREAAEVEVMLVDHGFEQESMVIYIMPKSASSSSPITIIGAHCDSINRENPWLRAPGADDDGSGTVTVLEAYRAILESKFIPTSPLEFHFYAGEEGGLLGSLDIADSFVKSGKNVRGMFEFDMTAWVPAGSQERVGVVMNRVDPALTEWTKLLIDKYLDIPWVETAYPGFAGSDHQSWMGAGYPAAHSIEGAWGDNNVTIPHTTRDKIDISPEFSFDHILQFTKLAVAFAVELSDY